MSLRQDRKAISAPTKTKDSTSASVIVDGDFLASGSPGRMPGFTAIRGRSPLPRDRVARVPTAIISASMIAALAAIFGKIRLLCHEPRTAHRIGCVRLLPTAGAAALLPPCRRPAGEFIEPRDLARRLRRPGLELLAILRGNRDDPALQHVHLGSFERLADPREVQTGTPREPLRTKSVTHVSDINRNPCVRYGPSMDPRWSG
jgi:hypothetical protein